MTSARPIAVIGSSGQVARALVRAAHLRGVKLVAGGRDAASICDRAKLQSFLERHQPWIAINAAAYTAVDKAESEPQAAHRVNAEGAAALANMCADANLPLIHLSTDYVFDGRKGEPYNEQDVRRPVNVYGASKVAGEDAVMLARSKHLIVRTSWVYESRGNNFLRTMLRLGEERAVVRVVDDQTGQPTYASHLANALLEMALQVGKKERSALWGTYHLTASGTATWHGFAAEIFRQARARGMKTPHLEAITSPMYPTAAARPLDTRLDTARVRDAFGIVLPDWRVGVAQCLSDIAANRAENAA